MSKQVADSKKTIVPGLDLLTPSRDKKYPRSVFSSKKIALEISMRVFCLPHQRFTEA